MAKMAMPLNPSCSQSAGAAPVGQDGDGFQGTLLVVDDETTVRCSLKQVFQDTCRVIMAENAYQALALVRQFKVHVAILDIRMPGMTGVELLARLKEVEPSVQVIMLSAYEQPEYIRESLRLGACDYITKPFEVNFLRASVSRAMARRQLADEIRANQIELRNLRQSVHQARVAAEEARQRGEIYASVIHDLNNPLTAIAGAVELLNQELNRLNLKDVPRSSLLQEHLEVIQLQVRTCGRISRRYLGFLRQGNAAACTDVNQTLHDIQMLTRTHKSGLRNQLIVRPLLNDTKVRINGTDLVQVILNLVLNAFQACQPPITVTLSAMHMHSCAGYLPGQASQGEMLLHSDQLDDSKPCVAITVSDNGPGIPDDILHRVFEPYFTTKAHGEGSGLGLAIVSRLVRNAGGAIHVLTQPARGTTFRVLLPTPEPPARP